MPIKPNHEQWWGGKPWDLPGQPGCRSMGSQEPVCRGSTQNGNPVFSLRKRPFKMRSAIINKILSFQYLLGRQIGRKRAGFICITLERIFTTLFGREGYEDKKIKQRR
jgi:hypothetical protein